MKRNTLLRTARALITLGAVAVAFSSCDMLECKDDDRTLGISASASAAPTIIGYYGGEATGSITISLEWDTWSSTLTKAVQDASADEPVDVSDYFDISLYDENNNDVTLQLVRTPAVYATGAASAWDVSKADTYANSTKASLPIKLVFAMQSGTKPATGSIGLVAKPAAVDSDSYISCTAVSGAPTFSITALDWSLSTPTTAQMAAASTVAETGKITSIAQLTLANALLRKAKVGKTIATLTNGTDTIAVKALTEALKGEKVVSVYVQTTAALGDDSYDITFDSSYVVSGSDEVIEVVNNLVPVYYGQDYQKITVGTIDTVANGANNATTYTITETEDGSKYLQWLWETPTGERVGSTKAAGITTMPDTYVIEFDTIITAGTNRNHSVAIYDTTTGAINGNNDITKGYLFKIATGEGETNLFNGTTTTNEWFVYNGDTMSTKKVTLDGATWYHVKATVDVAGKSTDVIITPTAGGDAVLDTTVSFASDATGIFSGIYIRGGRNAAGLCLDNVVVHGIIEE